MDMVAEAEPPVPVRKTGSLFDIYDLGRQTLRAGESYQLNIRQGSWPATFDYLTRPLVITSYSIHYTKLYEGSKSSNSSLARRKAWGDCRGRVR